MCFYLCLFIQNVKKLNRSDTVCDLSFFGWLWILTGACCFIPSTGTWFSIHEVSAPLMSLFHLIKIQRSAIHIISLEFAARTSKWFNNKQLGTFCIVIKGRPAHSKQSGRRMSFQLKFNLSSTLNWRWTDVRLTSADLDCLLSARHEHGQCVWVGNPWVEMPENESSNGLLYCT